MVFTDEGMVYKIKVKEVRMPRRLRAAKCREPDHILRSELAGGSCPDFAKVAMCEVTRKGESRKVTLDFQTSHQRISHQH